MIRKYKCNEEIVTPWQIETRLRSNETSHDYLQSAEWAVGYLDTTLTLKYDGYTYICQPSQDIDEDFPWDEIYPDKWEVVGNLLKAHRKGKPEVYELPNFHLPKNAGQPQSTELRAEYEWTYVTLNSIVHGDDQWLGILLHALMEQDDEE